MRRRCLHFDDDQQSNTTNGADPRNAFGNEGVSSSAVPIAELGHINPSSLEPAPPPYRQLPTLTLPQTSGKPIIQGTKPSGFGLHLNSIINSVQCGATISMKRMGSGSFSIRGKSSSIIRLHSSESSRSGPLSCNETNQLAKINNNNIDRDQAIAATSEAVSFSHSSKLEEVEASKLLGPISCDKRKYSTSNNIIEEITQSNPNKRRLKRLDNDDGDGCKNCNCKKTKCLKLYCECFAAGIYCAESCSCQGCFNKPEHENIVIDTRKQVESRNPHAFAPKIIQHATATSTKRSTKDGVLSSSSKHKRGCNCKKSMCIKKYCECYQANVGCSDGCRCDGCQNVFGRKEGYGNNKHLHKQGISEACDVATGRELPKVATPNDTSCTQPFSPHELTPRTPSYQDSNDGKDRSKSWYPSTRYLPSPESATVADSYLMSLGSSGNISNLGIVQVVNKDNLELVPSHQKLDDVNLIDVDEFSPRYHGHGSISNPPSLLGPHDWATTMGPQPISENCNFSPASSLQWRRSPISSMTSFEENKYHGAMDSDSGLYEGLEDDTPDILKNNLTPLNSVKLCSPNQKRVSPPHTIMQELCSSSSSVLKSCRKFILKSVPSFPPIDPKDKNPDARQC